MLETFNSTIKHRRGDTGIIDLDLKLDTGEAYSLLDTDKAVFSVKKSCRDKDYVMQKQLVNGQIIFTHEDTKDMPYGDYCYDIEVTLTDGQVFTVLMGKYSLLPDITV